MTENIKPFYECEYCFKKLTTQARLDKHNCEAKKRADYMATNKGKSAFYCYEMWNSLRGFKVNGVETFMDSKYFKSIERFIKFCNSTGIPDRKHYIEYMISKEVMPFNWTNPEIYDEYIQHFDNTKTPEEMARISMDTLFDLADLFDCEINEVLSHMYASDLMKLVVARKLSPWILLPSKSFKNYMRTEVTAEQTVLINSTINYDIWGRKFRENPEAVQQMKEIVKEMDF